MPSLPWTLGLPGEADLTKLQADIAEICRHYSATLTDVNDHSPPVINNPDNPYIAAFRKCITTETGIVPEYISSFGTTDTRFLMSKHVPCIITRPAGGGQHADSEWLDAAGYEQFRRISRTYVDPNSPLNRGPSPRTGYA